MMWSCNMDTSLRRKGYGCKFRRLSIMLFLAVWCFWPLILSCLPGCVLTTVFIGLAEYKAFVQYAASHSRFTWTFLCDHTFFIYFMRTSPVAHMPVTNNINFSLCPMIYCGLCDVNQYKAPSLLSKSMISTILIRTERWPSPVEGDCLESSCGGNSTGGSNPPLSAKLFIKQKENRPWIKKRLLSCLSSHFSFY